MRFTITIWYKCRARKLEVDHFYQSNQIERYRVYGQSGSIVLQNNYPLVSSTKKNTKLSWKLLEGEITDAKFLNDVIIELERELNHSKYWHRV